MAGLSIVIYSVRQFSISHHPLHPLTDPSTHPSTPLFIYTSPTCSSIWACILPPAYSSLLSHSFLEATHLFICPSIHPSILSKSPMRLPPPIQLLLPPCLHVHGRICASHLPTHLFSPRLSIQPFLHFFHLLPFLSTVCLSFSSVSVYPHIHSLTHHPSTFLSFSQAVGFPFTHPAIYPSTRPSIHAPTQPANVF